MTTVFEIPLTPSPQQLLTTLNGILYTLTVQWCDPNQAWTLDIGDAANVPILQGVPMVTGLDLLEQFAYLELGFSLYVQTDYDLYAVPTFTNLGITAHLYVVTP